MVIPRPSLSFSRTGFHVDCVRFFLWLWATSNKRRLLAPSEVPILPARAAPMGGPFEGFVFANSGFFQKAPWQALEKVVAGCRGGVALGFGQPRRGRWRSGWQAQAREKDVVSAPTHVVVTDNVDATTREKLEREYPGARVVTGEWVASKRRGDATPVKTKKAPSPSRTRAVVPARDPDDALPRDHPQLGADPPAVALYRRGSRQVRPRRGHARVEAREDPAVLVQARRSLNESLVASMREMARLELQGGGMRRQHEFGPGRQTLNEKELQYAVAASVLRALPSRLKMESPRVDRGSRGRRALSRRGDVRAASTDGRHGNVRSARRASRRGGGRGRVDAREEREGEVGARGHEGGFGSIATGPPPTRTRHGHEDGGGGGMVTVTVASGALVGKIDEAGAMRDLRGCRP